MEERLERQTTTFTRQQKAQLSFVKESLEGIELSLQPWWKKLRLKQRQLPWLLRRPPCLQKLRENSRPRWGGFTEYSSYYSHTDDD